MKKQQKSIRSPKKPVRSLDQGVLTEARGGDGVPVAGDPYIGEQHNETLVRCVRARRGTRARAQRAHRR